MELDPGGSTLIECINNLRTSSVPFAAPKKVLQVTEASLVQDVLQILQGYPTSVLPWDHVGKCFYVQSGLHVLHLSQSSLHNILGVFTRAASSLRRVDIFVAGIMKRSTKSWLHSTSNARPTAEAFANVVHLQLEALRNEALEKEMEAASGNAGTKVTLLSLFATLPRLFAGAEFLEHVVHTAVPGWETLYESAINAGQSATHILSSLYQELDSSSLLQDAEEYEYGTLLLLFVGCLWPTVTALESWLGEGILSDPAGELFFYEDKSVPLEDSAFWEKRYRFYKADNSQLQDSDSKLKRAGAGNGRDLSRTLPRADTCKVSTTSGVSLGGDATESLLCPSFLRPLAKSILSAGKSLQLLQHARHKHAEGGQAIPQVSHFASSMPNTFLPVNSTFSVQGIGRQESSKAELHYINDCCTWDEGQVASSLVPEQVSMYGDFCASLRYLLGEFSADQPETAAVVDQTADMAGEFQGSRAIADTKGQQMVAANDKKHDTAELGVGFCCGSELLLPAKNPLMDQLKSAQYCRLPALDDTSIRAAIFVSPAMGVSSALNKVDSSADGGDTKHDGSGNEAKHFTDSFVENDSRGGPLCLVTDFNCGVSCGKVLLQHDSQTLAAAEKLLPYPTFLPSLQGRNVCKNLPCSTNNWIVDNMLEWLQEAKLNATPASVLIQECLIVSIQKQVNNVGQQLLSKLMGEWRLMEELALLRAIYLVGSGDLLQQFASVLFNKLDRGEPWDDFYELNTMLQESVRSSSHGTVLPALDSLVVMVSSRKPDKGEKGSSSVSSPSQIAGRVPSFGSDSLDALFFSYKVAWPLELIIDSNAITKYNQVMLFLLKVKRAKHALDKACRWTWKKGMGELAFHKRRLLLQQKLMHFVNTLHQYIMDRVLYSAWVDLCDSMSSASSLDEVIACHDAYLISIQRQCLVAPDKLWTLIAGRVKTVLGLALNYYSIQRVLYDEVGAPGVSAWSQVEIERVERQFDECMVFLMRVLSFKLNIGHFPHLADLVTRINYNFYYMTEDGRLSTPISESIGQTPRKPSRNV